MENLNDLLPIYYSRLFPFRDYCDWFGYGNSNTLARREFSFTVQGDIYIRFLCFRDAKEMQSEVKRLLPHKIDIGAVYNVRPSEQRKCTNFQPVEKELVFDIDMTDYDEVRTCCEGANICNKCWKFMTLACKILDAALRNDFGFKHILWVFSGRRGIHCWVCDPVARFLNSQQRSCIAEYLQLISGGEFMKKKVSFTGNSLHHSVRRALSIIEPNFVTMCIEEQKILGAEKIKQFLDLMPEEEDKKELTALFKQCSDDVARWNMFCNFVQDKKTVRGSKWYQYRYLKEEIMFQYSYPRLDIEVSKGMNHLLKSPFCVHPKTGKVCVPFTASIVDKFDPDKVPTIMTLIDEINQFDAKEKAQKENGLDTTKIKDYKKTSLIKYYHIFHQFLWALKETQKKLVKQTEQSLEF